MVNSASWQIADIYTSANPPAGRAGWWVNGFTNSVTNFVTNSITKLWNN